MKKFDEIWEELREKDFDFKLSTYSEGSPPYEYSRYACEAVYKKILGELETDKQLKAYGVKE